MKTKLLLMIIAAVLICQSFTLQSREVTVISKKNTVADSINTLTVIIGDEIFRIDGNDSLVIIKVGDRGLNIRDSEEGKKVNVEKYDELRELEVAAAGKENGRNTVRNTEREPERYYDYSDRQDRDEPDRYRGGRHFRGHWSGMEAGFNNWLYAESMTLPEEIDYMTLRTGNSNCFNLNFSQVNIGFGRYAGLVTGLGVSWNIYRFDGQSSIMVGPEGYLTEAIPENSGNIKKSKFNTLYLNAPLLLEFQIPAGYSRLNIAAGVSGGIKLNAWTKLVFHDGEKVRTGGEYNLNLVRGGITARVGYENFMIYGTYYCSPWFQDRLGPERFNLEPFEIGLAFTFND